MTNVKQLKQELRLHARKKRLAIDPMHRERAEERMRTYFLSLLCLRDATTLLTFYPKEGETNVLPLAAACRARGIRVAYPICTEEKGIMEFRYVDDEAQMVRGKFGIPEPPKDAPLYTPETGGNAICIVPGMLFDKKGMRLGYGGGYYDRFFINFPGVRIGMTMHSFLSEKNLPSGKYDLPIHVLITEKGVTTIHAF